MTQILLATLTSGVVSSDYCDSISYLYENPISDITIKRVSARGGPLVAHSRNLVVKHFLGTTADYLLFVDADIKFEPSDIQKLLYSDKDIVGAKYYGYSQERDEPYPTWEPVDRQSDDTGFIDCKYVGMGFTLLHRSTLEQLGTDVQWPFGHEVIDGLDAGEDVTFCKRARAAGLEVFINAYARVYHWKGRLV